MQAYLTTVCCLCCSLSEIDSEVESSDAPVNIAMATSDSATHVDSMDTDNNCHSSVVRDARDNEIQICLHRLLAVS